MNDEPSAPSSESREEYFARLKRQYPFFHTFTDSTQRGPILGSLHNATAENWATLRFDGHSVPSDEAATVMLAIRLFTYVSGIGRAVGDVMQGYEPVTGLQALSEESIATQLETIAARRKAPRIPVVAPPDSGLVCGGETARSIRSVTGQRTSVITSEQEKTPNDVSGGDVDTERALAAKRRTRERIPDEAIKAARKAGTVVLVDYTIKTGSSMLSLLDSLPEDYQGKVIIAACMVEQRGYFEEFLPTLAEWRAHHPKIDVSLITGSDFLYVEDGLDKFGAPELLMEAANAAAAHTGTAPFRAMLERFRKRRPDRHMTDDLAALIYTTASDRDQSSDKGASLGE